MHVVGWDKSQNPRVGFSSQRDLENSTLKVTLELDVILDVLSSYKKPKALQGGVLISMLAKAPLWLARGLIWSIAGFHQRGFFQVLMFFSLRPQQWSWRNIAMIMPWWWHDDSVWWRGRHYSWHDHHVSHYFENKTKPPVFNDTDRQFFSFFANINVARAYRSSCSQYFVTYFNLT